MDPVRPQANVWPRTEPFLLGALQVAPTAKLSLHYLRKMATYVRTRDGCFPMLGWIKWRHIAVGKLQLKEELAWLYFETFDLLSSYTSEERLEWAEALSLCSTQTEVDHQKSKLCVDTLQFILFLYIQHLNNVSLRTSLIGEEWPTTRARSPSPDREAKTHSQINKNWDDRAHLGFIQTHLCELLELVVEPGQLSSSGQATRDSQVSLQAVAGLSFLLEGWAGPGRGVQPLYKLLTRNPFQSQAGFSKLTRSFPLQQLTAWLRRALVVNPFGLSSCMRTGKKMDWAQQVEGALKKARIVRNTDMAPPGSRMVLMSQVFKQTIAKDSEKLVGANIKLHRCSEAFLYLLSPLRSVSLEKCRNTTVVLGPVETSVQLQGCDNMRLVCVAGRVTVGSSTNCTIHALTPRRPLLLPGNTNLTLGPFHTHYPTLEDHMARAGLAVVPSVWNQPLLLGSEDTALDPGCYRLLDSADFYFMVVPFKMEGDTCEVPGGLPPEYQKALDERERRVQKWQRTLMDANLNIQQRRQFQDLVERKFHDWLLETGHRQELDCLSPPSHPNEPSLQGGSGDITQQTKKRDSAKQKGATCARQ